MKKKKLSRSNGRSARVNSRSGSTGGKLQSEAGSFTPKSGSGVIISDAALESPPPDHLLELARGEPNRKVVQDYIETIRVLRDEKGFTFREIAGWLTENGVEADHNAAYRAYTKGMPEDVVAEMDREPEDE